MLRSQSTPLHRLPPIDEFAHVYVKDESVHPRGTFKDRLTQAVLRRYRPGTTFAVISYGNTALSLAHYLRRGSQERDYLAVVVPQNLGEWRLGPTSWGTVLRGTEVLEALGGAATVIPVDLRSRVLSEKDIRVLASASGVPTERFVDLTEGIEEAAYVPIIIEAIQQLGRHPEVCVVQFGAGVLCNEIIDYCEGSQTRVVPVSVSRPDSLARMLYGPVWVDTEALERYGIGWSRHRSPDKKGMLRTPYRVYRVTELQVREGIERARTLGLCAEPSGSVGLGVLGQLREWVPDLNPREDTVLLINTGNGIDALRHTGRSWVEK